MLNKNQFFFIGFLVLTIFSFSQETISGTPEYPDYKSGDQFENFNWRRKMVAYWQINQLKTNALVIRLKTNSLVINALIKKGDLRNAEKKRVENFIANKNIYRAFLKYYTFNKVYFIYTDNFDPLLNGLRKNIFLDTNLVVNPDIEMKEDFYLLAEPDFVYNSSIGFVKIDSAKSQRECGSPTNLAPIVFKNKFGHQLKAPFPYYVYRKGPLFWLFNEETYFEGQRITVDVGDNFGFYKTANNYYFEGAPLKISIPMNYTYKVYISIVTTLNDKLFEFYESSPKPENDKHFEDSKPFLY